MTHKIITRFPPSPSGYLHIGGARTALFNWLYARHFKGHFVLRIEDTDTQRSTRESVDAILDALEWLGIDWDEGPYFQSQRFDVYREYIQKLVDSGHAYYCSCTAERVDQIRKEAMASGGKPKYDGLCREKGLKNQQGAVVRFKAPLTGTTVIDDVIKGPIVFQNTELDDFIILRSDNTPTYNLAVVVDDITMNINTVIRGDDHVNNTPKQILLYKAFGVDLPIFGHVPMVLGSDKSRLSKRHGAMSVTAYREMGYLPEAMINYLVRLGWSYGDQEFFTVPDLIEKFSMENIGKSAGVFNPDKLLSLNADHIKAASPKRLSGPLLPFLVKRNCPASEGAFLNKVIETLKPRSKTLEEMAEGALFYYVEDVAYEEAAAKKFLTPDTVLPMTLLAEKLKSLEDFTEKNLEDIFKSVMDETGLKLGKIAQPVRVALTGKTASPGIFEIIEILGKDAVAKRLTKAVAHIEKRTETMG
ncbi:MAG: glutamate--tRNA ligase [Desulfobacteraceae bacterium]|nr:glutamate--tRNA ligase [Desulfobacteraceae bacterium]